MKRIMILIPCLLGACAPVVETTPAENTRALTYRGQEIMVRWTSRSSDLVMTPGEGVATLGTPGRHDPDHGGGAAADGAGHRLRDPQGCGRLRQIRDRRHDHPADGLLNGTGKGWQRDNQDRAPAHMRVCCHSGSAS